MRCLLSSYLGQFPQNIDIAYSLFGKPYLPAKESLHFNISHSGDNALYAITNYYKIGIDLEYIDRNIDLDGLAFDIFSPLELTHWQKMMSYEKADFFFKSWVCKEAFLKASGKGWLAHQKDQIFKKPPLLIQKHKNIYSRKKIKYPYCFDSIDGYASALHVVGPSLHPSHYIWKRSSLENTINLQN